MIAKEEEKKNMKKDEKKRRIFMSLFSMNVKEKTNNSQFRFQV